MLIRELLFRCLDGRLRADTARLVLLLTRAAGPAGSCLRADTGRLVLLVTRSATTLAKGRVASERSALCWESQLGLQGIYPLHQLAIVNFGAAMAYYGVCWLTVTLDCTIQPKQSAAQGVFRRRRTPSATTAIHTSK
jgi:hypothetical protein